MLCTTQGSAVWRHLHLIDGLFVSEARSCLMNGKNSMLLHAVPFEEKHLLEAARILAARHRAHRVQRPELSLQFEDEAFDLLMLQTGLTEAGTDPVVALRHNRVIGYLIGRIRLSFPGSSARFSWRPRNVSMPSAGLAVEPEFSREAYSAIYAGLSLRWIAAGLFSHYIFLPTPDRVAIESWFSVNFGLDWTYGARDSSPLRDTISPSDLKLEIGLAESEDRGAILRLLDELYRYHVGPPCYLPYVRETVAGSAQPTRRAWPTWQLKKGAKDRYTLVAENTLNKRSLVRWRTPPC